MNREKREGKPDVISLANKDYFKIQIPILATIICSVAIGAWHLSSLDSRINSNEGSVNEALTTLKEIAVELRALVRHEEKFKQLSSTNIRQDEELTRLNKKIDEIHESEN